MKDTNKLYTGFRDFVVSEKIKDCDNKYFSRKKPSYKFIIPFVYKYINIETLKSEFADTSQTRLITFFYSSCFFSVNLKALCSLTKEYCHVLEMR